MSPPTAVPERPPLYGVYKSENNYGYANTIGVVIILLGAVVMTIINRLLRTNEDDY